MQHQHQHPLDHPHDDEHHHGHHDVAGFDSAAAEAAAAMAMGDMGTGGMAVGDAGGNGHQFYAGVPALPPHQPLPHHHHPHQHHHHHHPHHVPMLAPGMEEQTNFSDHVTHNINNDPMQQSQLQAPAAPATEPSPPPPPPPEQQLTRRQKSIRGLLAKIDSIYTSVHALESLANLLSDTCSYLEVFSTDMKLQKGQQVNYEKALQLPCDCIRFAIDGLDQHGSIISQAIVNSSDTKEVAYAQKKLFKSRKFAYAQRINPNPGITNKAMERDPKVALQTSLGYAKETLGGILERMDPDFLEGMGKKVKRKRKRGKTSETTDKKDVEDVGGEGEEEGGAMKKAKAGEDTENEDKSDKNKDVEATIKEEEQTIINVIELPSLMPNKKRYSPYETVAYIQNLIEYNPGSAYVRAYKEEIIAKKLVPVQKSQLNVLVKMYGGKDKPVAPLKWNNRGAKETGWDPLLSKFQEKQLRGLAWSIDDTRDALTSAAKETKRADPSDREIQRHHATLVELHNVTNHVNRQIIEQEKRLRENPPVIPTREFVRKVGTTKPKPNRFDKHDKKYRFINLPKPAGDNLMYTPAEAIENILKFKNRQPDPPSRVELRVFKEKMIAERIVPISISQLNHLVLTHGGPGKKPAPRSWNLKGREELMAIEDLVKIVMESQIMWTFEDTCNVVWAEKRKKFTKDNGEDVKRPDKKTVNGYHTALLSIPELAGRVIKPEFIPMKPGPKPKNSSNLETSV